VGKANGSRECAPDDKLRVPTSINASIGISMVGTARRAPLVTLRPISVVRGDDSHYLRKTVIIRFAKVRRSAMIDTK
jgi:hypothetical protein